MERLLRKGFWLTFIKAEIYQIKGKSLICQGKPVRVPGYLFFSVLLEMAVVALLFLTARIKMSLEGREGCEGLLHAVI